MQTQGAVVSEALVGAYRLSANMVSRASVCVCVGAPELDDHIADAVHIAPCVWRLARIAKQEVLQVAHSVLVRPGSVLVFVSPF